MSTRQRRTIFIILIILVLIGLGKLTVEYWAPLIAKFLIINEPPKASDIIIIPSGTDNGGRIRHGVNLYKKGFAPKILLSGSSYLWNETKIDLMEIYTMKLGVPKEAIIVDHDSSSTIENAIIAKDIVLKNGFSSILIVTSPTHSRRAKIIFEKVFPKKIHMIVSCDLSDFNINKWWKLPMTKREVFYEYFVFLWYTLFGY